MTKAAINKTVTIIILAVAATATVALLQSCDDTFGRPPDAYSMLK